MAATVAVMAAAAKVPLGASAPSNYKALNGYDITGIGDYGYRARAEPCRHMLAGSQKSVHEDANLRRLSSNPQIQKANFSRHNIWSNKIWGGKDWHRHHYHWFRWYGPVFWPYFEGDYFCYGFWPDDCSDIYWGYGPDVILWGAFWPYGEYYTDEAAAYEGGDAGGNYGPFGFPARTASKSREATGPMQSPLPKPAPASHPASAICPFRRSKTLPAPRTGSGPRSRNSKPHSPRQPIC